MHQTIWTLPFFFFHLDIIAGVADLILAVTWIEVSFMLFKLVIADFAYILLLVLLLIIVNLVAIRFV